MVVGTEGDMWKKVVFVLFSLGLLFSSSSAQAETAKDVYLALMRLASQCEVGIPRAEFKRSLGEAKLQYNLYISQQAAKINIKDKERFEKILKIYEDADTCASGGSRDLDRDDPEGVWGGVFQRIYAPLLIEYPQLAKDFRDGGATHTRGSLMGQKTVRVFRPDDAVGILIGLAGAEVKSLPVPK